MPMMIFRSAWAQKSMIQLHLHVIRIDVQALQVPLGKLFARCS